MSVVNSMHFPQAVDEQLPGYHHPTPEKKLLIFFTFSCARHNGFVVSLLVSKSSDLDLIHYAVSLGETLNFSASLHHVV